MLSSQPAIGAEELCRNYAERVFRFAAMIARADAEAEDIAQEALLKAIRRLDTFDPGRGAMETWLWRIVVNTARDAGRASGRRAALWERLRRFPDQTDSVESIVVKRLSDAQLLNGVRNLPPRDRTLIALRFGAGLDHAAAGSAVGISSGAATMALRRALRKLRTRLEATYEQDS